MRRFLAVFDESVARRTHTSLQIVQLLLMHVLRGVVGVVERVFDEERVRRRLLPVGGVVERQSARREVEVRVEIEELDQEVVCKEKNYVENDQFAFRTLIAKIIRVLGRHFHVEIEELDQEVVCEEKKLRRNDQFAF